MIQGFKQELQNLLKLQLPGNEAQNIMAPLKRKPTEAYINNYPQNSAVLVLIYPKNGNLSLVAILRPDYKGVHSGQVSLPGGKQDPVDKDLLETALREAKEEIGINPKDVEVLGALTNLYIPASNFIVHPFLAVADTTPDFSPDAKEVKEILEIRLSELMSESNIKTKPILISTIGKEITTPYFDLNGKVIWGATAMILSELKELLKQSRITFS